MSSQCWAVLPNGDRCPNMTTGNWCSKHVKIYLPAYRRYKDAEAQLWYLESESLPLLMTPEEIITEYRYAYSARVNRDRVFSQGYHPDARDEGHAYRITLLDQHLQRLDEKMAQCHLTATLTEEEELSPPTRSESVSSTPVTAKVNKQVTTQPDYYWTISDVVKLLTTWNQKVLHVSNLSPFARNIVQYIQCLTYLASTPGPLYITGAVRTNGNMYNINAYAAYLDHRINNTVLPYQPEPITAADAKLFTALDIAVKVQSYYVDVKLLSQLTDMKQIEFSKLPNGTVTQRLGDAPETVLPSMLLPTDIRSITMKMVVPLHTLVDVIKDNPMIQQMHHQYVIQCDNYAIKHNIEVEWHNYEAFCEDLVIVSLAIICADIKGNTVLVTTPVLMNYFEQLGQMTGDKLFVAYNVVMRLKCYGPRNDIISDEIVMLARDIKQ